MDWLIDHLAVIMFVALVFIMFLGYPVAFVLGAVGVGFGLLGSFFGTFSVAQFATLLPRIFGQAVQNPVLVAVPMFIFMGTMLERSGIAEHPPPGDTAMLAALSRSPSQRRRRSARGGRDPPQRVGDKPSER